MIQTHVLYIQTVMQITADGESAGAGDASVTEHWSNTAGATLDITFNGTKLELYGKKAANHAMFSVSIDGSEAVECDAYAAVTEPEAKLFESKTLAAGNHTAHITVLEKRNEASTGTGSVYGVQFVYAKAFEAEIAEPEFPGYTEVDDAVFTTNHELQDPVRAGRRLDCGKRQRKFVL